MIKARVFLIVLELTLATIACDLSSLLPSKAQQTLPQATPATKTTPQSVTSTASITLAPVNSLGSIRFTPDSAKKQSVDFAAVGKGASVSVTDAAGYQWTLTIPKDALLLPQTISLIPLASIDSSQAALPVKSGVLMEPDGLEFADAATLTVTPPASMTRKGLMVITRQDGSEVEFAEVTWNGSTYSAPIWHFSGGGWGDPPDDQLSPLEQQALAQYRQAEAELKALERVVEPAPVPPDLELKCQDKDNDAAEQQADAYEKQFWAKERGAIQRLMGAAQTLARLDVDPGDNALAVVKELFETRVARRVNALFADYSNDPKKLFAATKVVLSAERQCEMLGCSISTSWLPQITDWVHRARDYYLDKLRKEHDYSVFPKVLIRIERTVVLLTGNDDSGQFLDEMAKAMTFKLTFDANIKVQRSSAPHAETRGEIMIKTPDLSQAISGSGTGTYLSAAFGKGDVLQLQSPQSFPVNAKLLNWDSCEKMTVDISIDRFGADLETYLETQVGKSQTYPGIANGAATRALQPYMQSGGITVSLHNKQAEAVNETKSGQVGDANQTSVDLQLILLHTPQ